MKPNLIVGGCHTDARGTLRFCNDFDMSAVKRFYTIANSSEQPRRGWIMHKRETKWFFPLRGITKIVVESDQTSNPPNLQTFILDASHPSVLCVPPNHWFLIDQTSKLPNLQTSLPSEVQVFSNCRVGEFPNDDFRRPE